MATTAAIIDILMLLGSWLVGLIVYRLFAAQRVAKLEDIAGVVLNIILLTWVGKVVFQLPLFLQDPIAVLAYPSSANALYFGIFIAFILLTRKAYKESIDLNKQLYGFVYSLLFASFSYNTTDLIVFENTFAIYNLIILAVVVITLIIVDQHLKPGLLSGLLISLWSAGHLIMQFWAPFTTTFSFLLAPWFVAVVLIAGISLIIHTTRKKVSRYD
ncbi:hypothetical protein ACKXGF_13605 [Alkalibacillus sp. S2W]|uniref:hypothetical protein n=1 Tax=Alkalibacillus sp. S2W TaxID=3386553 RepID=UPI00398D41B7